MIEKKPATIDEYIAQFPENVRDMLESIRKTIQDAAPDAVEAISYAMPTFRLNGNLIHFAAYKNHIGLYPAPVGIAAFKKELSGYKQAKGSVQFPLNEPLPLVLIGQIAHFRVQEMAGKLKSKKRIER